VPGLPTPHPALEAAVLGGATVCGDFAWSPVDTPGWAEGFEKRFGTV
jgi:beta-glucosidase/6-phospho-beta-glucosidase/beta-galactosidase